MRRECLTREAGGQAGRQADKNSLEAQSSKVRHEHRKEKGGPLCLTLVCIHEKKGDHEGKLVIVRYKTFLLGPVEWRVRSFLRFCIFFGLRLSLPEAGQRWFERRVASSSLAGGL